jgi:pyruvate formate lyase activating enzyme
MNTRRIETDYDKRGVVFNMQRYTVHDGPGTRTQVFLKGCPLRCKWCDNPESWRLKPEIGVYSQRCIGIDKCGWCLTECPESERGVFGISDNVITGVDRRVCTGCLKCAEACPANALTVWGKEITVSAQIKEVLKDIDFFKKTGGGITLSGGEPFFQWEFTWALLKEAKRYKLHTCVETALAINWAYVEEVLPYIDFIITDIKHMDAKKHEAYTGQGNNVILENIKKLLETSIPTIVRVPVVPEHNDSKMNIEKTAEFLRDECANAPVQLQLLPFHEMGRVKYVSLGMEYPLKKLNKGSAKTYQKKMEALVAIASAYNINTFCGANQLTGY